MSKKIALILLIFFGLISSWSWASRCPSPEGVLTSLKKLFPRVRNLRVEELRPSPVPGFCEVVVVPGPGVKKLFYVDETGRYAFFGRLYDLKQGENLTQRRLAELNRLRPDQLKELDSLVAFQVGRGPKTLYLVTDPDCPFCRRLETTLDGLLKEGRITLKVILYPLTALHPEAKKKCISLICDHKGWSELLAGYVSDHLCPEGQAKVEKAIKWLRNAGLRGTPALILPDGRVFPGAKTREQILHLLNS